MKVNNPSQRRQTYQKKYKVLNADPLTLKKLEQNDQKQYLGYDLIHSDPPSRKYCSKSILSQETILLYQWRKLTEKNVVQIFYVKYKSSIYENTPLIFTQHLVKTYQQFNNLSIAQLVFLFRQTLIGFQQIYKTMGEVYIKKSNCGINNSGRCRVWINSNFSSNQNEGKTIKTQRQIILNIFLIMMSLQSKQCQHFLTQIQQYLQKQKYPKIKKLIDYINHYSIKNRVIILNSIKINKKEEHNKIEKNKNHVPQFLIAQREKSPTLIIEHSNKQNNSLFLKTPLKELNLNPTTSVGNSQFATKLDKAYDSVNIKIKANNVSGMTNSRKQISNIDFNSMKVYVCKKKFLNNQRKQNIQKNSMLFSVESKFPRTTRNLWQTQKNSGHKKIQSNLIESEPQNQNFCFSSRNISRFQIKSKQNKINIQKVIPNNKKQKKQKNNFIKNQFSITINSQSRQVQQSDQSKQESMTSTIVYDQKNHDNTIRTATSILQAQENSSPKNLLKVFLKQPESFESQNQYGSIQKIYEKISNRKRQCHSIHLSQTECKISIEPNISQQHFKKFECIKKVQSGYLQSSFQEDFQQNNGIDNYRPIISWEKCIDGLFKQGDKLQQSIYFDSGQRIVNLEDVKLQKLGKIGWQIATSLIPE